MRRARKRIASRPAGASLFAASAAERTGFPKLQGAGPVPTAQKPVIVEYLKSVRIKERGRAPAGEVVRVADPAAADREFKRKVPECWQTLAAKQMQVAKFAVPARDAAKAEVFVSVFPCDIGGELANVHRWGPSTPEAASPRPE